MAESFKTKTPKRLNGWWLTGAVLVLSLLAAIVITNPAIAPLSRAPIPPPPPPPLQTTLFFAGDIMLSRNVGTKIIEANDLLLPFKNVSEQIKSTSLAFANLESMFSDQGPRITEGFIFKAEPNTIEGLTASGFDVLSTANNHTLDQGEYGMTYTMDWLRQHGIVPVGTSADCHKGVIIQKDSIKFGFLAYTYGTNEPNQTKKELVCDFYNQKQIEADIAALKPNVDFLIVSAHRGAEYKREPEEKSVITAHAAIDAGADMFVGHHPHWIQTTEEYKGKFIFYSLGNFVFDQDWSVDTSEGLTLLVTFEDGKLKQVKLVPVVLENNCCPRWANAEETKIILQKINLTSDLLLDKN